MKLLIVGWYNLIHPIISAKKEFETLGYKVYFLPLLHFRQTFRGEQLYNSLHSFICNIDPNVILWWNWELEGNIMLKIKKNTKNIIHCLFNWDHPFCLSKWEITKNRKILSKNIWDIVFVTGKDELEKYIKTGSKEVYYLRMFGDEDIHFPDKDKEYECDISFVLTGLYDNKMMFPGTLIERKKLIQDCIESGFDIKIYGPKHLKSYFPNNYYGFSHFLDNRKVFHNSKINLCTHVINSYKYCNERVGTVLSSGGLLFVDKVDGIDEILTDGHDCILIDNNNYINQIKDILNNYHKYEHIKKNAVKTARKKFSLQYWSNFIDSKIKNFPKTKLCMENNNIYIKENKVSIVMTYYNRISQLTRTLDTIEESKYPKELLEVICLDDRSDKEPCIIDCSKYSYTIKFIYSEYERDKKIINSLYAYNNAFKYITGEYVIIQNAECLHVGDIISYSVDNIKNHHSNFISFPCWASGNEQISKEVFKNRSNVNELKNIITSKWDKLINYPSIFKGWYNEKYLRPQCLHFCIALHRDLFDKNGLFNINISTILGFDDNDYAERIMFQSNANIIIPEHNYSQLVVHQYHGKYNKPRSHDLFLQSKNKYLKIKNTIINDNLKIKTNIFNRIPKIAHFMWSLHSSYTDYVSILSFIKLHPCWKIYLHLRNTNNRKYIKKLLNFSNFEIKYISDNLLSNIKLTNLLDEHSVLRFYTYYLIYEYGGFWIDTNLIFTKNIENIMYNNLKIIPKNNYPDTIINKNNTLCLFAGKKKNILYKKLYSKSLILLNNNCKNINNNFFRKTYNSISKHITTIIFDKEDFIK